MRYGVKILFITAAILAIVFSRLAEHLNSRPIVGELYTPDAFTSAIQEDSPVIVAIYGNWYQTTTNPLKSLDEKTCSSIRRSNTRVFEADWTETSPQIEALLASAGIKSAPAVLVYNLNGYPSPVVVTEFPLHSKLADLFKRSQ